MSLLLGLRGSSQKSEEKAFRESIIQQQSYAFLRNSPTTPLWGGFSSANAVPLSSSSTTLDSLSSAKSNNMDQGQHSEYSAGDKLKPVPRNSGFGSSKEAGPSMQLEPESSFISSDNFIFSSKPSTSIHATAAESPYVSSKTQTAHIQSDSTSFDNRGQRDDPVAVNKRPMNDRNLKAAAFESYSSQGSFFRMPHSREETSTSFSEQAVRKSESKSHPTAFESKATSTAETINEMSPSLYTSKPETSGVFIFGVSGSGSGSASSSGNQNLTATHQRMFNSSFVGPPPRTRNNKFKRHSNVVKGKVSTTMGSQKLPSDFGRETSQTCTGSVMNSSCLGSDEWSRYSDGVWLDDDVDVNSGGAYSSGTKLGVDENFLFNEECLPPSFEDKKHSKNIQNVEGHFESWSPFSGEGSRQGREAAGRNAGLSYGEGSDKTESFSGEFPVKNGEPGAYSKASGEFPVKDREPGAVEPDILGREQKDSTGSPELPKNFIFGSSQSKSHTDSKGGVMYGGIGMEDSKDNKMHKLYSEHSQKYDTNFPDGSSFSSGGSKYSAATVPSGVPSHQHFDASMDQKPSFLNPNFNSYVNSKPYTFENHSEYPTGEFSGPLSSTDSSASESSPVKPCIVQPPFGKEHFEFQGITKNNDIGPLFGKKKSRSFLPTRRQKRGTNRSRKSTLNQGAQPSPVTETTSSMDFSPYKDDTTPNLRSPSSEQRPVNLDSSAEQWADLKMHDREDWMQFNDSRTEKQSAGVANPNFHKNQEDTSLPNVDQESMLFEHLNARKRNGKWKRTEFEDSSRFENQSTFQTEREDDFEVHENSSSFTTEGTSNSAEFTFGASSQPAMPPPSLWGQPQKLPKELDTDGLMHFTSTVSLNSTSSNTISSTSEFAVFPNSKILHGSADSKALPSISSASFRSTNKPYNYNTVGEHAAQFPARKDSSSSVNSAATEQVCERWRLRGNQAYANGDFPKAEEYYSRGASSVSPSETSQSCIRASMLCYSNRAATRMAVGRIREALADCMRAMVVDPSFLRVRLRAASCHLALGESKAAVSMFKDCLKYAKEEAQSDSKVLAEASEGVKKAQQVDDYSEKAIELLKNESLSDSTSALRLVNEALSISPYSESLNELKARVLLLLRRYVEVLQFCEQSLPVAERNHGMVVNEHHHRDSNPSESAESKEKLSPKLWRWRLSAKALYHLGRLDEALDLLKKHAEAVPVSQADKTESWAQLMANIRDMLRHKAAGNEAFQQGKHSEAVEHYTAALACNGDSRPYNAVCFCNRAAASQALGQIADAIADCSRAIALDPNYAKALSRRATLHELIRDYGQACHDLRRFITLLENLQVKSNEAVKGSISNTNLQDLNQARDRLSKGEEELKKSLPIDHYLVLGLKFNCSPNDIKKAYRKAALKHHPDKAGQLLTRGENGDGGSLWKEVGDEVRRDCERLFKLIGEAYAVLSDHTKRLRYDTEEEHRKLRSKDSTNQGSSGNSEVYRSETGRQHRDRWDASGWPNYGQHQRWQTGPDAAQPDTYARRSMFNATTSKFGNTSRHTEFYWDDI